MRNLQFTGLPCPLRSAEPTYCSSRRVHAMRFDYIHKPSNLFPPHGHRDEPHGLAFRWPWVFKQENHGVQQAVISHACFPNRLQFPAQNGLGSVDTLCPGAPLIPLCSLLPKKRKMSDALSLDLSGSQSIHICSFLLTCTLECLLWEEKERLLMWICILGQVGERDFRIMWPWAAVNTVCVYGGGGEVHLSFLFAKLLRKVMLPMYCKLVSIQCNVTDEPYTV